MTDVCETPDLQLLQQRLPAESEAGDGQQLRVQLQQDNCRGRQQQNFLHTVAGTELATCCQRYQPY